MNSSIVHAYIHATFKTNGFSLKKSNLCIPKFDATNELHMQLVNMSKTASKPENEELRTSISDQASAIYVEVCKEFKNRKRVKLYTLDLEEEPLSLVAEPKAFEYYSWSNFDKKIVNIVGGDKTILVGCYKNKKHLDWILDKSIYNIRLGNRQGSVDEGLPCINNASLLVLYNSTNASKLSVYRIKSHKIMSGDELKQLNYPKKRTGKQYMTFEIEAIDDYAEDLQRNHLIENLIVNIPDYVKGTPVFLEP